MSAPPQAEPSPANGWFPPEPATGATRLRELFNGGDFSRMIVVTGSPGSGALKVTLAAIRACLPDWRVVRDPSALGSAGERTVVLLPDASRILHQRVAENIVALLADRADVAVVATMRPARFKALRAGQPDTPEAVRRLLAAAVEVGIPDRSQFVPRLPTGPQTSTVKTVRTGRLDAPGSRALLISTVIISSIQDLQFALADSCGMPPDQVPLLHGQDLLPGAGERSKVMDALDAVAHEADDVLLVFYGDHSVVGADDELYLIPPEFEFPEESPAALSFSRLCEILAGSEASPVLILNCGEVDHAWRLPLPDRVNLIAGHAADDGSGGRRGFVKALTGVLRQAAREGNRLTIRDLVLQLGNLAAQTGATFSLRHRIWDPDLVLVPGPVVQEATSATPPHTEAPAETDDPQRVTSVKVVVVGGFGAGKTTMVGALSEIMPVTTEVAMTQAGAGVDDIEHLPDKTTLTSARDAGRITLGGDLVVYLMAVPGPDRFWPHWDDIVTGAIGVVVLVDTQRLAESFASIDYCERLGIPFLIAVNRFDGAHHHDLADVRNALDVLPEVPVIDCDARIRESSKMVIISLIEHALTVHTAQSEAGSTTR